MIEQTNQPSALRTPPKPLPQTSIAMIRVLYDTVILVLSLAALFSPAAEQNMFLGMEGRVVYVLINTFILAGSITAFFLLRQGKGNTGIKLLIYSLIIGMFINSIYIEGVGSFGLAATILFTAMSIPQEIKFNKGIIPMATALILGTIGLIFDIVLEGASFRSSPLFGTAAIWVPTLIFGLAALYVISRQFSAYSLRAKLISSFVLVTVLSLILLVLFNIVNFQQILIGEADKWLYVAAVQASDSVEDQLKSYIQTTETYANLPSVIEIAANPRYADTREMNEFLNLLPTKYEGYLAYEIIDINGRVVSASDINRVDSMEKDISKYLESLWPVESIISNIFFNPETKQATIDISSPVVRDGIYVIGSFRVRLDAKFLQELIQNNNNLLGEDSFAVLFDDYFLQLANGAQPETIYKSVSPPNTTLFEDLKSENRFPDQPEEELFLDFHDLEQNLTLAQNSSDEAVYFDADDIIPGNRSSRAAVVKVSDTPWLLAYFQPRDVLFQPLSNLGNISVIMFIVAGLFATGIGLYLTQVIAKPIASLNENASKISAGDFSSRVEITSQDELGTLGQTFNLIVDQLQALFENMEDQVVKRTHNLEKQTTQLKTTAEISRDAASEEELEYLLDRTSHLLYDRFGFYHVGIYLIDPAGQNAVLASSQDPRGEQLLANGHRYKVDTNSSVGLACAIGRAKILSADDQDGQLTYHPLLPNTKAQLTVPLRTRKKIIGAIDIHNANPQAFSDDDIDIFKTFSDQIANAIENIEFREEIQSTLNELEATYGQFTQESWRRFIQGKRDKFTGFRFHHLSIEPLENQPEDVLGAWNSGEIVTTQQETDGTSTMLIPMKVRGEVIGVLDIQFETEFVPPETQNLMTEIADRLGLVLENARLIETAQQQVEQEQLAAYLTNQIRQSLDLDTVLRTATQEIGSTLGLAEVEVRLGSLESGISTGSNGNPPPGQRPPGTPGNYSPEMSEEDYESIN